MSGTGHPWGVGAARIALPAMLVASVLGLRAEILASRGLGRWASTLDEPGGDVAALEAAHRAAPWRADLSIALGLHSDLPDERRERHLKEAVRGAPSSALAYLALGALHAERGDETGALALYSAAEGLDRMGSATQIRLGALYLRLMRLDEALPRLARAARIAPESRLSEAITLAATVTSDAALLDRIVPPAALYRIRAAWSLEGLGLDDAAELQYEQASTANPSSAPILEGHLRFHLRKEERDDAIRLIRARLDRTGFADLPLRLQLAQLLIDTGRIDQAADALEAASRFAPASEQVVNHWAILALAKGNVDGAVEIAQGLVDRRPELAAARVTLARALWGRGDRPGAARELAQAQALEPARADVQLLLGRLNREMGDVAEAARCYRRAIDLGYVSPAREELATLPSGARVVSGGS